MPRVNFRFRDDEGNIVRMTEYEEPGIGDTVLVLVCAGVALNMIFILLETLQRFLGAICLF